jgi:hypothetical protein
MSDCGWSTISLSYHFVKLIFIFKNWINNSAKQVRFDLPFYLIFFKYTPAILRFLNLSPQCLTLTVHFADVVRIRGIVFYFLNVMCMCHVIQKINI